MGGADGYSAGPLVLVENGRDVHKSTEMNSCPKGYKIWSPRIKNDWEIVWRAMKKKLIHFPRKPHLIIDVTNPNNNAGKDGVMNIWKQKKIWQTSDGSNWWLRDTDYARPGGQYISNCYMDVTKVDPSDVQFKDSGCDFHSTDYFCQPENGA